MITIITEDDADVNNENASQFWCVGSVWKVLWTIILHYELRQIFEILHQINNDIRADYRAEEINFTNNDNRKAEHYQFCLWTYGKLGKGNRCVLIFCVVKLLRTRYPVPKGTTCMGLR